jgi:putative addiction module killer protein
MEASQREVEYYRSSDGKEPYGEWFAGIKDQKTQQKLDARLARMRGGNFGDSEPIGGGASENKIDHGPGYRIYYGIDGKKVIILKGGDKSTQASDIELARKHWTEYKNRKKEPAPKKKAKT